MLREETEIYLNKFAKYVVQQSRANLSSQGKNGNLYNSIASKVEVGANSFRLQFLMEDYGKFQDKGVKGKDPTKVSSRARIKGQQAPNSPYKFGSGKFKGTWRLFVNSIDKWVRAKGIRLRDDKGRYTKGNVKTISQIIASNIYARGIKPSLFFTKPFEAAFRKLPDELIEAYGLDVEEFLQYTINKK